MVDKNIKKQCKAVKNLFLSTLENDVEAAAFLLGNLYRFQDETSSENKALIKETLGALKKTLTKNHLQKLWQGIHSFNVHRWQVMDKETKLSIEALKKGILQDNDLMLFLEADCLLVLGGHPRWYREVFLTLIRQHLVKHNLPDPFSQPAFSYDLLLMSAPEQNYLYMGKFLKQCQDLPVSLIGKLGIDNPEIVPFILLDCQNHPQFFEISRQFVEIDSLRDKIISFWKSYVENYPLNPEQKAYMEELLPRLQSTYPEFKAVSLNSRVEGHYISTPFDVPTLLTPELFDLASVAVMAPPALYFSGSILVHLGSLVSLGTGIAAGASSATLTTLATSVAATAPQVLIPLTLYGAIAWVAEGWFKRQKKEDPHPAKGELRPKLAI